MNQGTQVPVSAGQRFLHNTREAEVPVLVHKKGATPALVPALAGLVMIAVESLNSFLQKKQSKAMATSLSALRHNQTLAWKLLWELEHDFLIYGKYNVEKLQDIFMTVNSLWNRTLSIERLLTGQDLQMLQVAHMVPDVIGRMTFIHKLNLYVHSMLERQIRLYEWLLCHLQDLLDSIGILSTRHLPPELFPPTVLQNVTANAIEMVHKTHPDYALAIRHITEYYDMKLAMFGLDSDGSMVVAFPVFVKDHASEPKTLYEIEMAKVPIPNKNKEADSYSEVKYSKPYTTFNSESRSCKCANRLGTHITVRNCSSLSTRQSIAVKVPYSIISQLMWCIQFVSLTTFTTPQYHLVSLMEVQISSWLTCSALRGSFVQKIPPWPDLCPATPMS